MPWGATITLAAPCPAPETAMAIEGAARTAPRSHRLQRAADRRSDRAIFHGPIREVVRGRTEKLEALAVEMHARGLSTCGIGAAFAGAGGRSLLSRTAVSEITWRLRAGVAVVAGAWRAMKSGSISLQTVFS